MNAYKITLKNGVYWVTSFNGSLEEAKKYFLGHIFEGYDEKPLPPVTDVESVESWAALVVSK